MSADGATGLLVSNTNAGGDESEGDSEGTGHLLEYNMDATLAEKPTNNATSTTRNLPILLHNTLK